MSSRNICIVSLRREPVFDDNDVINFKGGVNVITGEKDAGKTVWMKMLDYLMADSDVADNAFGPAVAAKYNSLHAVFRIGEIEFTVERKWKEKGCITKIYFNGEPYNTDDFGRKILEMLGIPLLRFPKGNPYEDRTWPELSWRMLYRHIYRQERFWSDFADKQPLVEQHACVCQFMGVAQQVFPKEYGELVSKQKELLRLQMQVSNFSQTLQVVMDELVRHEEFFGEVSEVSIKKVENRLKGDLTKLKEDKLKILEELDSKKDVSHDIRLREVHQKRVGLATEIEKLVGIRKNSISRSEDLTKYRDTLRMEVVRLNRALISGDMMADLKVTQCPACDQKITPVDLEDVCYLCGKHHPPGLHDSPAARKRVEFETDRVSEELIELDELIRTMDAEIASTDKKTSDLRIEIALLDRELSSVSRHVVTMLPPDFELISQQEGRLFEQLRQLAGIREALQQKDKLVEQIKSLKITEEQLISEIDSFPVPDFEVLSSEIEGGMNNYLKQVSEGNSKRWGFPPLSVTLTDRNFNVRLNKRRWDTQMGVTSQALVFFAYHYSLLRLSCVENRNYPGLVVLEFPVELADTDAVGSSENYLLEPFVKLCDELGSKNVQVIATGRSFKELKGSHQIHLDRQIIVESVSDDVIALEDANQPIEGSL